MKYLVIILIILFGCNIHRELEPGNVRFIYLNNTKHNVEIKVNGGVLPNSTSKNILIELFPETVLQFDYFGGRGTTCKNFFPFGVENLDSAIVIFNSSKKIVYRKDDNSPRNILDKNVYSVVHESENSCTYEYVFTEDDFKNAEPIN